MSLVTRNPTSNTSPDPGQGGNAVTSPSNTGHASTNVTALDASDSDQKSCLWSAFAAAPGGGIVSVTLKIDHTSNGARSGIGAQNSFTLDYSLNNGGSWTNAVTRTNFTTSQGPTTFSVALPVSQDLTQVRVRDNLLATTVSDGESASVDATIANIKIEVVTADAQLVVMM